MSGEGKGKGRTRAAEMAALAAAVYHVASTTTGTEYKAAHAFKCQRCGGTWKQERAEAPARCPCCGYVRWNEKPEARTCQRCGHSWRVPQGHPRGKCPNCKSRFWDKTPKRGNNSIL